ncbi:histone acetyltransferases subunit 3-domain-containing protein [Pilobolus umbonatus]|nr:histone acetyltransferases subunit 3-domain-containing protein [Pilobolus umbonatus]
MSRQAALETIRRRRRREETESPDNVSGRSESPHPTLVKLKRSDSSTPSKSTDTKKKRRMSITPTRAYTTGDKQGKHHQKQKSYNTNKQQQKDELDFVRVKPKDQVPILTFWSAMEPYFRPITEEDREFLMKKADNAKPYIIPPLGQHYTEQWAEEDQVINYNSPIHHSRQNSIDSSSINNHVNTHINTHNNNHNISNNNNNNKLKYVQDNITDDQLLEDDLTCGGLTERLLSSLVMEDIIDSSEMQQEDEGEEQPRTAITADVIVSFEERLRRELRYAGLFGDEDIDWNANEDDEICAELRSLGRELKEQVKVNDFRKKRLLQVVDCQLQFDQYRHVLDTLDAQVEQGYMKRFRTQKSKKRRHNTGIKSTLSENALYAMEKRKTWIDALGNIFKDKNLTMPSKSIYSEDIT